MSLATRCTACGTVFRVVQDQLRVSEGWVRCGRCTEVFNAVENLVDPPLTAGAAGMGTGLAAPSGAAMARMGSASASGAAGAAQDRRHDRPAEEEADALPEWARSDLEPGLHTAPGRSVAEVDSIVRGPAEVQAEAVSHGSADADDPEGRGGREDHDGAAGRWPTGFEPSLLPPDAAAGATATAAAHMSDQTAPSFVRRADRAARWQQPRVRRALAAVVLLAGLGLLAQAAHSYRDLLAARWPATRPLLAQACTVLGCTVQAPRLIDALVVDSSGLLRVERSSVYKLSLTLRNQDLLDVALPALDLTLTDTQGGLVARRVLRMEELGQNQKHLAAGAELVLQATLQTPEASASQGVAGYTIELFYP